MNILCRFGTHNWREWHYVIDEVGVQARMCKRCGLGQRRVVKEIVRW